MTRRTAAAALGLLVLCACSALGTKPAWEQPPPPVAEGPIVPQQRLHRATLENGLEVLVLEDHRTPRLSVGITLRRGIAVEPLDRAGLASLTTEVMKRGAGSRDALALARAVEDIGASLSADAGWDSTGVGLSGLSGDADTLYALLADVVRRPRFDPAEVARARAETLQSLEQDKDEPEELLARALDRVLYPDHRYGIPGDGDPRSLAHLDAHALREFHDRLFVPRNAIFHAVGDISADDALTRARAAFGDWTGGPVPDPGPAPPAETPTARRIVVVDRPDLVQAQIALAHEGIARTDPDRIQALLMNTVLGGGGFLSRLMTRARAEQGLTYSIGSGFSMRRHAGPFAVTTFTRVPEVGRVVSLVLEVLEGMKTSPPTEDEFRLAKSYNAGRFVLGFETSGAIAAGLIDLDVYGLPADSLDTYRTRVNATTREELADQARRLLHPERIAIVVVGPAEALRPQLAPFGAVEVVEP
jgi:zinc protease